MSIADWVGVEDNEEKVFGDRVIRIHSDNFYLKMGDECIVTGEIQSSGSSIQIKRIRDGLIATGDWNRFKKINNSTMWGTSIASRVQKVIKQRVVDAQAKHDQRKLELEEQMSKMIEEHAEAMVSEIIGK